MLTCRICNCLCDPADLKNMICDDCQSEIERKQFQKEKSELLMLSDFRQMDLNEVRKD